MLKIALFVYLKYLEVSKTQNEATSHPPLISFLFLIVELVMHPCEFLPDPAEQQDLFLRSLEVPEAL